jgi:hypothetical protein
LEVVMLSAVALFAWASVVWGEGKPRVAVIASILVAVSFMGMLTQSRRLTRGAVKKLALDLGCIVVLSNPGGSRRR